MTPAEARHALEGLIGNQLRLTADTADNVAQAAHSWLLAMKEILVHEAQNADIQVKGVNLASAADSLDIDPVTATDGDETLFGLIIRNGTQTVPVDFRLYQETAAGVAPGDDDWVFGCMVPGAVAANSPGYRFVTFPGGLTDLAGSSYPTANGWSAFAAAVVNGTTAPANVTLWTVYRED